MGRLGEGERDRESERERGSFISATVTSYIRLPRHAWGQSQREEFFYIGRRDLIYVGHHVVPGDEAKESERGKEIARVAFFPHFYLFVYVSYVAQPQPQN